MSALLLVWSGAFASTVLWASIRAALRSRRPADGPGPLGRVLVVRPCAGDEPSLRRALESSGPAARALAASLRFAVADPEDPAADTARCIAASLRSDGIDAGVDFTMPQAPNRKAAQIARVLDDEPLVDILIVADSDVQLEPATLQALTAPLRADPSVAASWAAPVERSPETLADRASAGILDASLHCFALLSALDAGSMVGKLFAVRARALESAGGFRALSCCLGEDMELARRLRERGHGVALAQTHAYSLARGRSFRQAIDRYARWIHVIRGQRAPLLLTYPTLLAAMPVLVLASAVVAVRGQPAAFGAVLLAIVARAGAAVAARLRTGGSLSPGRLLGDALLADALLLAAFVQALIARRISWRGNVLRHAAPGHVEEVVR